MEIVIDTLGKLGDLLAHGMVLKFRNIGLHDMELVTIKKAAKANRQR